jgi:glucose/arabinose dehydrogenase
MSLKNWQHTKKNSQRTEKNWQGTRRLAVCFCLSLCVLSVLLTFSGSRVAFAATVPSGFTDSLVANGLSSPTAMELAPDGRIFVCEQGGALRIIKNGALLSTPFLSVTVDSAGERGLLGVAFDPNFAVNQFVYVYYTATTPTIHNRISRFTASGDVAVAGSEITILDLDNLSSATNHNGGAIHFGPDGNLFVAVGDNANGNNSQSLLTVLGKILRISPSGAIPTDNPFFNQTTGKNRAIWALGLRNPFTFSFQPGTGRMFINDVGQNTTEEINDGIAGSNYGWPTCEGICSPPNPNFRDPIYTYVHDGSTCAITGGTFYNPQTAQFPSTYVGNYFFADFCAGWLRTLDPANGNAVAGFATGISSPVDLKVSPDGSLYYLARGTGSVNKIQYPANAQPPTITSDPQNQTVAVGQSATFSVSATGTTPLSFQWQRNGADIAGATSSSYTLANAQLSDNGALFRARVTNSFGSATSNTAQLTVTSNTPPTGSITQPPAGTLYQGGETINYAGTGTDAEDGNLPASAFTWQVDFHHDTHFHPFVPPTSGATSGSFTIPTTGETSANVWYRIHLTVIDSGGLTQSSFRDILPRTSMVTLQTSPSGLQLKLDGQPITAPYSFFGVVGIIRSLEAVSPQTLGSTTYVFQSWSDGGAASHSISTPATDTTYTAFFNASPTDTTPPVVSITNPAQDATVARKSNVTLSATATDNVGVVRVEFYVNGSLQCTDSSSAYTCIWRVPNPPNRTCQIEARAFDQAGNSGSAIVQVTSR